MNELNYFPRKHVMHLKETKYASNLLEGNPIAFDFIHVLYKPEFAIPIPTEPRRQNIVGIRMRTMRNSLRFDWGWSEWPN